MESGRAVQIWRRIPEGFRARTERPPGRAPADTGHPQTIAAVAAAKDRKGGWEQKSSARSAKSDLQAAGPPPAENAGREIVHAAGPGWRNVGRQPLPAPDGLLFQVGRNGDLLPGETAVVGGDCPARLR